MIVPHVIDWTYIRRKIGMAGSDDALDLLRHELSTIRKGIINGGLLISDVGNGCLAELNETIKDLRQDGEMQPIPTWMNLSRELEAYRQCYRNCALRVGEGRIGTFKDVLSAFNVFLTAARLDAYDLPVVILTDDARVGASDRRLKVTLENYEDMYEQICWRNNETFDEMREDDFDRFMACVSLSGACFGEIVFQDPYLSASFNMSADTRGDAVRWRQSVKRLLKTCVDNPKIGSVKIISEVATLVDQTCQLQWLKRWLEGRHGRHNGEPLRAAIHFCKKNPIHHDRHLFVGDSLPGCIFMRGFDICNEQGRIQKGMAFGVSRIIWNPGHNSGDNNSGDNNNDDIFHRILRLSRHRNCDAQQLFNDGQFSCDIVEWQTECCPKADKESTFEIYVRSPIRLRLTNEGLV